MNVGAIILLVAVCGVCAFEVGSLVATIVKKKRKRKVQGSVPQAQPIANTDAVSDSVIEPLSDGPKRIDENSDKEVCE